MTSTNSQLIFDPLSLPIAQLESLKFKANQMTESMQLLQRTLEAGGQNVMPAWPDILSKYNILLSQSHNLSNSLLASNQPTASGVTNLSGNPFEKLALHPGIGMTDSQLDNELIPLLRNQQTTDVLKLENDIVRHLSEHMASKGSLGVLTQAGRMGGQAQDKRTEYEDVLSECEQIRIEHDSRVERAVRAVVMLREKYDWKARVAVDQEEPEELGWDPRAQDQLPGRPAAEGANENGESEDTPGGRQSNDSDEEEELEEVLGNGGDQTPDGTPGGGGPGTTMVEG